MSPLEIGVAVHLVLILVVALVIEETNRRAEKRSPTSPRSDVRNATTRAPETSTSCVEGCSTLW